MRPRPALIAAAAAFTGALLAAAPAEAHIVSSRFGDFYAGAMHPLTALEDVLLWVALGFVAGMQEPRRARWLIVAFPFGLLLGVVGARHGVLVRAEALWDGLAMVLLGGLLALAAPLPAVVLATVALALGLLRGYANAGGAEASTNMVLFTLGLATCGYAVATLSAAAASAFRRSGAPWRAIALRACGSWIAAIGCMFAVFAYRSL